MRKLPVACIAAVALILGGCSEGPPSPVGLDGTTIILVRHAEKADNSRDALLSDAGEQRAELLARMLMRSGVRSLLASEFQRTQLTLRPLAEALGLPIRIVPADNQDELLAIAVQGNRGQVSVISSHSDRIPLLIANLTGLQIPPISEDEYNRFYVVTILAEGRTKLLELRYGEGVVQAPERDDPLAPFPVQDAVRPEGSGTNEPAKPAAGSGTGSDAM